MVVAGDPPPSPYGGPMVVDQRSSDDADVMRRSGAAGLALECDGAPDNGGAGDYDSGLSSTQDSVEEAVSNWLEEDWVGGLPEKGYRVEREDDGRVLLSYDVEGRTKVAFIVANDVRDFNDDVGWGVETWAGCNPAELPAQFTDAAGIQIWLDDDGHRVSTTIVSSFQGAEHCDWQDIAFLTLGSDPDQQYVRDVEREFGDLLTGTYDAHASLPPDATDLGFTRDGRALWLVKGTAAYLVSVEDASDVERWPMAKERILCA